jgi:general secretion pathway protein G
MCPPPVSNSVRRPGITGWGFSIIEILIVITILSILASIASPAYENYRDQQHYVEAKNDILAIQTRIDRFYIRHNRFPDSLSEVDAARMTDPWGQPYFYLNIASFDKHTSDAKVRRDKKLKPVNSDYDLFSSGRDRLSKPAFTAKSSRDDIVRCNNGTYIGLASDY